jgi:hypothetical protein
MVVWEDHLLPLLTGKDAARLGRTCKALRGVMREHFRGDLGTLQLHKLQAVLTTFPRGRGLTLYCPDNDLTLDARWRNPEASDVEALVQWLREGGRGRNLEGMEAWWSLGSSRDLVHRALQEGALPSLRSTSADFRYPAHRASLTEGLFTPIQALRLRIGCGYDGISLGDHFAMLFLVRQLPVLAKLELEVSVFGYENVPVPEPWPPFTPPSLQALRVHVLNDQLKNLFLRALPGMLEASGARLDRLEVVFRHESDSSGYGLVHLAQALRCCSPTLTGFRLAVDDERVMSVDKNAWDYASQVGRLRVQWAELLAGVSACRELQVLALPRIEIEPLFPRGTAFGRLTHLEIFDHDREHPPDAGVVGLWELVASGGLPALTKLRAVFQGRWGGAEGVRTRVAPALEAVAGTLTHLHLGGSYEWKYPHGEVEVGYEFGVAVGKLRRLEDLALFLAVLRWRDLPCRGPGPGRQWPGPPSPPAVALASGSTRPDQCRPSGEPPPPECACLSLVPLK